MKTKLTFSLLCLFLFCCGQITNAQCDYYYWFNDTKICLDKYNKMRYILVDNEEDTFTVREKLEQLGYTVSNFKTFSFTGNPYPGLTKDTYWAIVESNNPEDTITLNIDEISYEGPSFLYLNHFLLGLSHTFSVRLHYFTDFKLLDSMAKKHGITILGNASFPFSTLFSLSCSKMSTGNAMEMANLFHESQLFMWSQPDFMDFGMLSISNISKIHNYSAYPNPASDYIKINNAEVLDLQHSIVRIFDISGKQVLSQNHENEIDVSMLHSGLYILKIYKDGKLLISEKFVKF
ncbi:MAG: T9SS type A sorting domain-containing protein [Bacteroidetes bacterium]|nr:T9SS type A sorting domain-containing protein [Bacteroidota bacterium]MCL2301830.1 T9SS type A sorting domain-containing protein [Lentimicrobiaceae bacterium]